MLAPEMSVGAQRAFLVIWLIQQVFVCGVQTIFRLLRSCLLIRISSSRGRGIEQILNGTSTQRRGTWPDRRCSMNDKCAIVSGDINIVHKHSTAAINDNLFDTIALPLHFPNELPYWLLLIIFKNLTTLSVFNVADFEICFQLVTQIIIMFSLYFVTFMYPRHYSELPSLSYDGELSRPRICLALKGINSLLCAAVPLSS